MLRLHWLRTYSITLGEPAPASEQPGIGTAQPKQPDPSRLCPTAWCTHDILAPSGRLRQDDPGCTAASQAIVSGENLSRFARIPGHLLHPTTTGHAHLGNACRAVGPARTGGIVATIAGLSINALNANSGTRAVAGPPGRRSTVASGTILRLAVVPILGRRAGALPGNRLERERNPVFDKPNALDRGRCEDEVPGDSLAVMMPLARSSPARPEHDSCPRHATLAVHDRRDASDWHVRCPGQHELSTAGVHRIRRAELRPDASTFSPFSASYQTASVPAHLRLARAFSALWSLRERPAINSLSTCRYGPSSIATQHSRN